MIQIGVRVPQEDAEFIANLKIEGATTPSDKVRAIIAEAHRRERGINNYQTSLATMQEMLAPMLSEVRRLELERQSHSELVLRVFDWLPELMAFVVSNRGALVSAADADILLQLERGLADRVFRLFESVMQLAVTRRSPCYQPEIVAEHLGPIMDLVRVINETRTLRK